jgi:hypothetical protein
MQLHTFCMAFLVALALTACAQDVDTKHPAPVRTGNNTGLPQTAQLGPIRVILQFRSTTTAFASAAFLQQLKAQTGAPVRYLASVSNDTHVYSFAPTPGQTDAQIVEQLRSMPALSRVSLDQKVRPQ